MRSELSKIRSRIQKWVNALESGQYKQGRLALSDDDNNYCCLGVGNKVCRLHESSNTVFVTTYYQLGLIDDCGCLTRHYDGYESLADLNDNNYKFQTIAKLIRNNPELMFTEDVVAHLKKYPLR